MTDPLAEEYPEAAQSIREAVAGHGEDWVLEPYYEQLYPLNQVMTMPEKEELPFFDDAEHDTISEGERIGMYEAWAEYRESIRNEAKTQRSE